MGLGRDAASGSHSLLMLHSLTGRGRILEQQAADRFHELLSLLLPARLRELESDLAADLMQLPGRSSTPLDGRARQRLHRFVSQGLPQDTILPELDALVRNCGSSGRLQRLSAVHRELLVALVLQKRGTRELVNLLPVDGKRELALLLRAAVGELLEVCEPSEGMISH